MSFLVRSIPGVLAILLLSVSCAFGQAVASLQPDVSRLVVYAPQPEYPAEARQRHIVGSGSFAVRVNRTTGRVATVQVLRTIGSTLLDSSAIRALRQWRFKGDGALPTRHHPHYSKILVPVTFK
jgi:TonB family protein